MDTATMELSLLLTPPPSSSVLNTLTPAAYLEASPVQRKLKEKFKIEHLDCQRMSLDPRPQTNDSNIARYHSRVSALLPEDRTMVHVQYNIDGLWETLTAHQEERFVMFASNTLIAMARLAFPEEAKSATTQRLQQLAKQDTKNKAFRRAGIPPKYWPMIKKLDEYVDVRNHAAHETMESFATLLTSPLFRNSNQYNKWADAFPIVCEATVEEVSNAALARKRNLMKSDVGED